MRRVENRLFAAQPGLQMGGVALGPDILDRVERLQQEIEHPGGVGASETAPAMTSPSSNVGRSGMRPSPFVVSGGN